MSYQNKLKSIGFLLSLTLASSPSMATIIEKIEFHSNSLGVTKKAVVVLPDNYNEMPNKKFSVIYQIHGWGVTEDIWTSEALEIQKTAQELGYEGLIVMPDGDRSLYINSKTKANHEKCANQKAPTPNSSEKRSDFCVHNADYEDYFLKDLIPHIENKYRVGTEKEYRSIGGESAGGFSAMQLALRFPDKFSSVVSHSGFLSLLYDGPDGTYNKRAVKTVEAVKPKKGREEIESILGYALEDWKNYDPYSLLDKLDPENVPAIYFDCGTKDDAGFYNLSLYFHDRLHELGFKHVFHSVPNGRHDDTYFKTRSKYGIEHHMKHLN